jgi:hypothetical protein
MFVFIITDRIKKVKVVEHGGKSNGIEILMSDVFVKINPTDPLRLESLDK